ncbi:MAG: S-layer homology domain-containing protein [Bacillota bacterium]|nr:S-layer homology domain-containing protein [Bacillota bacterium]
MKKKLLVLCLVIACVLAFGSMGALAATADTAELSSISNAAAEVSDIALTKINDNCSYAISDGVLVVLHNGTVANNVYAAAYTDEEVAKILEIAKANKVNAITLMTMAGTMADDSSKAQSIAVSKASMEKLKAATNDSMIFSTSMFGENLLYNEVPACTGDHFVVAMDVTKEYASLTFQGVNGVDAYLTTSDESLNESIVPIEVIGDDAYVITKSAYDAENKMLVFAVTGNIDYAYVDNSIAFTDMKGHWSQANVNFVSAREIMQGMTPTTFVPEGQLTRAMMVTMLYRLEGEPEVSGAIPFTDVTSKFSWAKDAVTWAVAEDITKGMTATTFAPNAALTREQAATFIYRYCTEYLGYDDTTEIDLNDYFYDASKVQSYAKKAMTWCAEYGIITGIGDNLVPQGTCTRAQMATILSRVIDLLVWSGVY